MVRLFEHLSLSMDARRGSVTMSLGSATRRCLKYRQYMHMDTYIHSLTVSTYYVRLLKYPSLCYIRKQGVDR